MRLQENHLHDIGGPAPEETELGVPTGTDPSCLLPWRKPSNSHTCGWKRRWHADLVVLCGRAFGAGSWLWRRTCEMRRVKSFAYDLECVLSQLYKLMLSIKIVRMLKYIRKLLCWKVCQKIKAAFKIPSPASSWYDYFHVMSYSWLPQGECVRLSQVWNKPKLSTQLAAALAIRCCLHPNRTRPAPPRPNGGERVGPRWASASVLINFVVGRWNAPTNAKLDIRGNYHLFSLVRPPPTHSCISWEYDIAKFSLYE